MKTLLVVVISTLLITQAEAVIRVNSDGSYVVDKGGVCVDIGVE